MQSRLRVKMKGVVPYDLQQFPFHQLFLLLIGPNNTELLQLGASGRNIKGKMVRRFPEM